MRYLIAETTWKMMSLSHVLAGNGTLLTRCDQAEEIEEFHRAGAHDLLVCDASLLVQHSSLARLRDIKPDVPICLLARNAASDQTAAWLMAGADAVLPDSAALTEMAARLNAVARRALGVARPVLECGPLLLDLELRRARVGEVTLSLSPKLYELLEFLALRPGRLASREELMSHVYGFENEPAPRVFDVYMCNLRSHLSSLKGALAIETVRGEGYRLQVTERRGTARPLAA
ncbi:response regulator transcription factor [Salipiger marinus]|uniref:response regulator transcription factor n=1 Tax=Salipiger marinus TaxID=555512 RepID=UPI001E303692|nr:response regulator transcription factor [Salipiger manganoxidans]MCD1617784.1 response regulator transcription factor [Salipiger manganoxidans]MEB3418316.1 response regulator transcription factor [Salipiger manganoxidans]